MVDRLVGFAFGALHAALLLLALVAILVATGGALDGIGTVPGILIGAWLAVVSWVATAWALRGTSLASPDLREVLGRAGLGGLGAGAAFVVGAFLAVPIVNGTTYEPQALLFLVFAAPFAGAFGCVIALLLALVDVGIYAVTRRALR